jgi:pilus assembly protein CpaC
MFGRARKIEGKASPLWVGVAAVLAASAFLTAPAHSQQQRSLTAPQIRQMPPLSQGQNGDGARVELYPSRHAGELVIPVNKSQVLRLDRAATDIAVGNPAVADVLPLTNQSLYVLGKQIGSTNVVVYGAGKTLLAVIDVVVAPDIEQIKARLHEIMPGERIEVRSAADGVVLSGHASSAQAGQRAVDISRLFAGDRVTNLMKVTGSQQVMLQVKFAEVNRTAVKNLNFNSNGIIGGGNPAFRFATGGNPAAQTVTAGVVPNTFLPIPNTGFFGQGVLSSWQGNLLNAFDALERKGLSKTLAEPTLIALSGDTANFLAGGEYPYPVVQPGGGNAITVEFRPFGVGLSFTPTVIDDQRMNIVVSPEVSNINTAVAVQVGGFNVPSISTRRASTTIELGNGQSFAIAGLLQNDVKTNISQIPWLGDIPILGSLFRSHGFQRDETELVILVTPYLVRPVAAGQLAAPTDTFLPPSEIDLFVFGRLEGRYSGRVTPNPNSSALRNSGGIIGSYGHILN